MISRKSNNEHKKPLKNQVMGYPSKDNKIMKKKKDKKERKANLGIGNVKANGFIRRRINFHKFGKLFILFFMWITSFIID